MENIFGKFGLCICFSFSDKHNHIWRFKVQILVIIMLYTWLSTRWLMNGTEMFKCTNVHFIFLAWKGGDTRILPFFSPHPPILNVLSSEGSASYMWKQNTSWIGPTLTSKCGFWLFLRSVPYAICIVMCKHFQLKVLKVNPISTHTNVSLILQQTARGEGRSLLKCIGLFGVWNFTWRINAQFPLLV